MVVLEIELPVQSDTSPEYIVYKNILKICFLMVSERYLLKIQEWSNLKILVQEN